MSSRDERAREAIQKTAKQLRDSGFRGYTQEQAERRVREIVKRDDRKAGR